MIYCNLSGGLGNQLFQIFATLAYALQEEKSFMFTPNIKLGNGRRYTYWTNFLSSLQKYTGQPFNLNRNIRELDFHYTPLPTTQIKDNVLLSGYFQSQKYFIERKADIYNIIKLQKKKNNVNIIYKQLFPPSTEKNTITISMHFRIGDYAELQEYHPIANPAYYIAALNYIKNNLNTASDDEVCVLYFCENCDVPYINSNIITRLKSINPDFMFIRCPGDIIDWRQMLLMSMCDHHIIANSTFSWWGAYFDDKEKKIVCYPERWFGNALSNHNTCDLCPPEWTQICYDY